MSDTLAIITVVYDNYGLLNDFLDSFEKQTEKKFSIFLVDLSDDKKKQKYPKFVNYLSGPNMGYAYGLNVGLKKAVDEGFERFVCMNNDTYVDKNFVKNVLKSLENRKSSIIGGKIYYAPGFEYHKDRYSKKDLGKVIWFAGGHIDWRNVVGVHRGVDDVDVGTYNFFEETDFVTGCLMCFDKSVLDKIGFFDESYFLYYEDADWCERAKRAGIKLFYDSSIVIWHKNAQSTGGPGSSIHQKYQQKNRLKFGFKYATWKTKLHLLKNLLAKSS